MNLSIGLAAIDRRDRSSEAQPDSHALPVGGMPDAADARSKRGQRDGAGGDRQWRLQLLVEASVLLSESLDCEQTLRRVAFLAVPAIADWCTISVVGQDGRLARVAVVHREERLRAEVDAYQRSHPPEAHRSGSLLDALRTGRAVLESEVSDDQLRAAAQDERHLRILRALGCSSCIIAPMVVRGEVLGVMSFMQSNATRRFEADDVILAEELARRAAVTADNARLYRRAISREQGRRRQSERRLELLIDSIRDYAVFMLDPRGNIVTWNPGAERIKGYSAREIIGRHFSTFYPASEIAAGKCEMELEVAARTGRFEDVAWRLRKDGSRFWANVVISAIKDEAGELVGFSKVTRDLSESKRAEEEQAARRAAEHANQVKDEFLAMLGHELRNPLAPIVTALQLMKLRGGGSPSKEHQIIERQVSHMVRLVDDLLDVSRITQGKIELKRHAVDLRDVVARAIEIGSPLLEQRRHHLEVEVPSHPVTVDGDDARLAQVLANLITNAAKYTESGGHITVAVTQPGHEALVEVRDDGAGIAPELLPRIFDPFVQGTQSAERSAGGLGIGLSLVRSLVDLHGGVVSAASPGPGHGSTFSVRLPVAEQPAASLAHQATVARLPRSSAALRVLVVDDNEDALELIAEVLRAAGHQVETAIDGPSALEAVRKLRPEVAVLDIGLPVMDGYELAAGIRRELGSAAPRLIALTGYGQQADHGRSAEVGFETHLVKPVDAQRLVDAVEEVAARGRTSAPR